MDAESARAMVTQLVRNGTTPQAAIQRDAIAQYVAAVGVSVLHAIWQLHGRSKGKPCRCTPCLEEPMTGELTLKILVSR